jgi:hypothetical protein
MDKKKLDENDTIKNQGSKFSAILHAFKSPETLIYLKQIIREIPRIRKNIERLKKYGIKHILQHINHEIFYTHFQKHYYSKKNIVKPINHENRFKKITLDTTYFNTELCEIGKKYNSDKSPHNPDKFRHAYTGIYHFLFYKIKNEKINVAEIGINKNDGMKMYRDYFKNANLYGFELKSELINSAIKDNLYNTKYFSMDVDSPSSIKEALTKSEVKFDIIIDDSSHMFDHQINIIKNSISYLKKDGYLIIEDIFNNKKIFDEQHYYEELKNFANYFSEIYFVQSEHLNRYSPFFDNDKLLVLRKS